MFSIGDRVKWTSQASGTVKEKEGIVTETIPIGSRPNRGKYPRLYRGRDCGIPRDHVSYIVTIEKEYYWPRVKGLERVGTKIQNSIVRTVQGETGIQGPTSAEIRRDLFKEMSGALL